MHNLTSCHNYFAIHQKELAIFIELLVNGVTYANLCGFWQIKIFID